MITISFWAKNHKREARMLLVVCQVLLFIVTVKVGLLLQQLAFDIHYFFAFMAVSLMAFSVIVYPSIGKKPIRETYRKRKLIEMIFLCSSLICIVFISNKNSRVAYFNAYQPLNGSFYSFKEKVKESPANAKKSARKFLKNQIKELRKSLKADNTTKADRIILVSLAVLLGIGLFVLVAGLSCSLSCNGQDGLAALVLLGGLGLIIFLLIIAIRKINRTKRAAVESTMLPGA